MGLSWRTKTNGVAKVANNTNGNSSSIISNGSGGAKNYQNNSVAPLSSQASVLMLLIHECNWNEVRDYLSSKKGAAEFTKALEYVEEEGEESSSSLSSQQQTSGEQSFQEKQKREVRYMSDTRQTKCSGYVSPGYNVSSSNFSLRKKKTPTENGSANGSVTNDDGSCSNASTTNSAGGGCGGTNGGGASTTSSTTTNSRKNSNSLQSLQQQTYVSPDVVSQSNFSVFKKKKKTKGASELNCSRSGLLEQQRHNISMNGVGTAGVVDLNSSIHSNSVRSLTMIPNLTTTEGQHTNDDQSKTTDNAESTLNAGASIPTLLHLLCTLKAPIQMIQRVLSQKPNLLSVKNNLGQTALHLSCLYVHELSSHVVMCLIKHNKKLASIVDSEGRTALHWLVLSQTTTNRRGEEVNDQQENASVINSNNDSSLHSREDNVSVLSSSSNSLKHITANPNDDDNEHQDITPSQVLEECIDLLLSVYPDALLTKDHSEKIPLDYVEDENNAAGNETAADTTSTVSTSSVPKWIIKLQDATTQAQTKNNQTQ